MSVAKYSSGRLVGHFAWLEMLLILSIVSLLLQIIGPGLIRWWHLPRPGAVGIDYLVNEYFQANPSSCLASGYVCHLPERYSELEPWPLVILLHGAGERGTITKTLLDCEKLLLPLDSQEVPAVVLLPQCLTEHYWQPKDVGAFFEIARQRYNIDEDRIYLAGYSMGGYGTWATASKFPGMFAAVVPIAGGSDKHQATELARIPTWAFHGAMDDVIPVEQTTTLVNALRAAGGKPKLTVLPDAGHDIAGKVLRNPELWQWLFQQHLSDRRVRPHEEPALVEENKN